MKFQNLFRLFLVSMALMPCISNAQNWANIGTVGTLNNNELCYTDGVDIICDAGLFVNGTAALEVSGTVSATAFIGDGSQLTGVTASSVTLALGDLTDAYRDATNINVGSIPNAITTGVNNVGFGVNSLPGVTSGADNTAIGHRVLRDNTTGQHNTGVGSAVLMQNTTGSYNVAVGSSVLYDSNGDRNTGVGFLALRSNVGGGRNSSLGYAALRQNTSGNYNTGMGYEAVKNNTSGDYNTGFGYQANSALTSGSNNLALGALTDVPNTSGSNQLNIANAIYGADVSNTGTSKIGINVFVPSESLEVSGTVSATAFVGDGSQLTGVTASSVTLAINDLTDGKYDGSSLFVGAGAGAVDDGSANNNVGVGRNALSLNTTGYNNSAFGRETLFKNETGINNTALGSQVLYENLSGSNNVGIGLNAMLKNSTGSKNIAIGRQALNYNTSGHSNVAVGAQASFGSLGLSTGSYNISIGEAANIALQSGNNNIAIGASTSVPSATGNNQLNIGNTIYGNLGTNHVAIGKYVDSNYELDVSGTIHADVVSATTFVGDGSGLTGLAASLAELTDVSSSMAPSANQLLGYNGSTSEWEPVDPSAAGLWTDAGDYIERGNVRFYDDTTATIDFPNSTRGFFFHEGRGALRAGQSYISEWDDADVGSLSVGFGNVGRLSGSESFGVGDGARVTANDGIAMGYRASVTGNQGVAIGSNSTAATSAYAIGNSNSAAGYDYLIGGSNTSTGSGTKAAFGTGNTLLAHRSYAYGANNNVEGYTSGTPTADTQGYNYAFGTNNQVTALNHAIAIGTGMTIAGNNSMGIGVGYSASGSVVADDNTLAIMGATGGVGIGLVSPNAELEVSGTVSATAFVGDGSGLTNLAAGSNITAGDTSVSIVDEGTGEVHLDVDGENLLTAKQGALSVSGNVGIGTQTPVGELNVIAIDTIGMNPNAGNPSSENAAINISDGTLEMLLDSNEIFQREDNLNLGAMGRNDERGDIIFMTGNTSNSFEPRVAIRADGTVDVTGTVSATAFAGDGSGLTNLPFDASSIAAGDTSVSVVDGGTGEIHLDADGVRTVTVAEGSVDISASAKIAGTGSEVCGAAGDLGRMRWNPVTQKFQICRQ